MPPKRTKTNTTVKYNITPRQPTHTSVSSQTEDECNYESMILDYKKQIDILTKKITEYEATVLKLQDENKMLKQQNVKLSKNTSNSGRNDLIENITIKEKSISPDSERKSVKGCGCKGNCGNKICGCVKKGISCNNKLCKCNSEQCRNQFQEVEKENASVQNELSQEGQKALEKLGRLTLNQEILHASEKKRKILFRDRENTMNVEKYSASPFGTRRRLFRQDSDDTIDFSTPETNSPLNNQESSNKPEIQFPQTSAAKHNRRLKNKDEQLKIVVTTDEIQNEIQSSSDKTISTDENFLPKIPKVLHSPVDVSKLRSVSPVDYIARRKYRNDKVSPSNEETDEKKNIEEVISSGRVQHSPKPSNKHQVLEKNEIKNSLLLVPNTADSNNILDVSLNPMVPKRQLPRSPISAAGNVILLNESKRFSPPKKELAVAEVDWEQHQSELILCKRCKRKFFPHRIEKHVTSCKGI